MAQWVLNFTKGGAKVKKQMPQQARELLDAGLWGVPPTAQLKDKVKPGDSVLAFVGAPDRVFVGQAEVAAGFHEWTADEHARYPMSATFTAGLALRNARVWRKPVPLAAVWPRTHGAKTNPKALWYGAVITVAQRDFALIVAAGEEPSVSAPGATSKPGSAGPPLAVDAQGPVASTPLFDAVSQLRTFLQDPKPLKSAHVRSSSTSTLRPWATRDSTTSTTGRWSSPGTSRITC